MKNFRKAKQWAKDEYEKRLKIIKIANQISNKVAPLLPDGWECKIVSHLFWLDIEREHYGDGETYDPGEFKLVCNVVEKVIDQKLSRTASVDRETNIITLLKADSSYYKDGVNFWINIYLANPKFVQDCEITWVEETREVAKVSDGCLGLS